VKARVALLVLLAGCGGSFTTVGDRPREAAAADSAPGEPDAADPGADSSPAEAGTGPEAGASDSPLQDAHEAGSGSPAEAAAPPDGGEAAPDPADAAGGDSGEPDALPEASPPDSPPGDSGGGLPEAGDLPDAAACEAAALGRCACVSPGTCRSSCASSYCMGAAPTPACESCLLAAGAPGGSCRASVEACLDDGG
jgi:hypothetical protein